MPVVDSDRIDNIYKSLQTLNVELDLDPLEFGPKRLNSKIGESRAMLSRCEQISLQVSHDLHWYRRRYRTALADHALRVQELLANDPDVRAGRSVTDREAVANMKLRSNQEAINRLHYAVEDLEAVMTVIRTKRADLKDTQGRLKDQLKVCQEELTLGSRWGSKGKNLNRPKASSAPPSIDDGVDESLDSLLDGAIHELSTRESVNADNIAAIAALTTSTIAEESDNTDLIGDESRARPSDFDEMAGFGLVSEDPRHVAGIQGNATSVAIEDALDNIPDVVHANPKMPSDEDLDSFLDMVSTSTP